MGSGDRPASILFFDGVCGLCNASVDFVLRHDRHRQILFCPLQSPRASELLAPHGISIDLENLSTFVFLEEGHVYMKSDAALRVAARLGRPWALTGVFRLVPRGLRDAVYSMVATNRYRWFGRRDTCRIPTPEERERFLV